jgi:hypothetical protein
MHKFFLFLYDEAASCLSFSGLLLIVITVMLSAHTQLGFQSPMVLSGIHVVGWAMFVAGCIVAVWRDSKRFPEVR